MNEIDPNRTLRRTVTVTEFRSRMAHYIASVRYGDDWLRIRRKGTDPVYLVSEADFRMLCEKVDEFYDGPRDRMTGQRTGRGFMYWLWQGLKADRKAAKAKPLPLEPRPEPVRPVAPPEAAPMAVPVRPVPLPPLVEQRAEETATAEARLKLLETLSRVEARFEEIEGLKAAGRE